MARSRAILPNLVIANATGESNIIQGVAIDDALALAIGLVSGDTTKTYSIQWSPDTKATSLSQWFYLYDGTAIVTVPNTLGYGSVYPWTSVGSIKIVASANVASTTTWNAVKIWEM